MTGRTGGRGGAVIYRPGTAHHVGAREAQEDAFAFSDLEDQAFIEHGGVLAVVADGMGGLTQGRAASERAVGVFLESYLTKSTAEEIPRALMRAIQRANTAVVAYSRSIDREHQVGTTLAAAVVHRGSLYWISVGDSRVYLVRGGDLVQVTSDHVYATELETMAADGRISRDTARSHPDRDALTSHLGLNYLESIDWNPRPFPLDEGDRVLVCTDGFYRVLTPAEIARHMAGDPQEACDALLAEILARGHPAQDNITLLTFGWEWNGADTPVLG